MANVTINNTTKANWLFVDFGDYATTNDDKIHYSPIANITGLCTGRFDNSQDYVEVHVEHEQKPIYLCYGASVNVTVKTVDSINGVAPTSQSDLLTKILALLP
jgi:hypothetical protein